MSNKVMNLVKIENNQVVTTSLKVAEYFEREHSKMISLIENKISNTAIFGGIKTDASKWFWLGEYIDSRGRKQPMYFMNRNGFMYTVMGIHGSKAEELKMQFILAFESMENQLKYGSQMPMTYLEALKQLVAKEEAYQKEKERADENQDVKDLYDTSVAQNNYWIPMKAVADVLDCINMGRNNLYRFLRDEGVLTNQNEPKRQYQELGLMKTSYYSDWTEKYVCVVSFRGLKFIFKKLKNANKIPRNTTFDDWVALCKDMVTKEEQE